MSLFVASTISRRLSGFVRQTRLISSSSLLAGHHEHKAFDSHKGKLASDNSTVPDQLGHSVGPERWELLAKMAGDSDPYQLTVQKRGKGSFEEPSLVPSTFQSRNVGCICHEEQHHINWMTLHRGVPKRCECGYWFKLVDLKQPDYSPK
jgi:cytochrome c oxidase subunit 5b